MRTYKDFQKLDSNLNKSLLQVNLPVLPASNEFALSSIQLEDTSARLETYLQQLICINDILYSPCFHEFLEVSTLAIKLQFTGFTSQVIMHKHHFKIVHDSFVFLK